MTNKPTNTEESRASSQRTQIFRTLTGNLFAYLFTFYRSLCFPIASGKEIFRTSQDTVRLNLIRGPAFAGLTISLIVIISYLLQRNSNPPSPLDEYIWLWIIVATAAILALYTFIVIGGALPFKYLVDYFCYYVSCVFVLSTLAIPLYFIFVFVWGQMAQDFVNPNKEIGALQSLVMWGATLIFILYANIMGYILCAHPIITFRQSGNISTVRLILFYGVLWVLFVPTIIVTLFIFYVVPALQSLGGITD